MRLFRRFRSVILSVLFIAVMISDSKNWMLYFGLLVVFGFIVPSFVFHLLYRKNPRIDGRVKDISYKRFNTVAYIEFEYAGYVYVIEENCNGEDQRQLNLGDRVTVLVDTKNVHHSQIADENSNMSSIAGIIGLIIVLLMYYYR